MFKIHLLSAIRKLLKDRFYSVINVSGLVIAVFTVSYQTIRAARANPAESLRYE